MSAALSIGLTGAISADTVRALAPRIERLGFDAIWLNDVPGGDSLAGLRVAASATDHLGLATGIIPLDRRPAGSLDLDGLPAARTTIGVGSGQERHPLALMRDGVAALRSRTDAEIVVGALGPHMREFAARDADGVLLNWLTPDAASEAMRELRREAANTPARGILYVRTISDPADAAARAALEDEAARYASFPAYGRNMRRHGFDALEATVDAADGLAAYSAVVDEVVVRAVTASGSLDELERFVEAIAAWRS